MIIRVDVQISKYTVHIFFCKDLYTVCVWDLVHIPVQICVCVCESELF